MDDKRIIDESQAVIHSLTVSTFAETLISWVTADEPKMTNDYFETKQSSWELTDRQSAGKDMWWPEGDLQRNNKPIITTRSIKPGTQPHTTYEHSTAFNWQSLSGIIMLRLRPTASLCVLTESDPHVLLALPLRNLKIKTNESEIYSTRYWNLKLELALCLMTKASRTWSRFINNMT